MYTTVSSWPFLFVMVEQTGDDKPVLGTIVTGMMFSSLGRKGGNKKTYHPTSIIHDLEYVNA